MNVICAQTSDDAIIKFGAVFDDTLGDAIRVTVVATGLSRPLEVAAPGAAQSQPPRIAPGRLGSGNPVRGGILRETPPHSILRHNAFQAPAQRSRRSPRRVERRATPRRTVARWPRTARCPAL